MKDSTLFTKTPTQVFSCEFCEIFKNICFVEHQRIANSVFFNIKSYLRYKTIFAIK